MAPLSSEALLNQASKSLSAFVA